MEKKLIYELHADHREWANKMEFYNDEIRVMRRRMSEVAAKNSAKDIQALVEHFENQLIVQKEQCDILKHTIREYDKVIEAHLNNNDVAADKTRWNDHAHLRDKVETFERIFNDLRKELIAFLSRWM
jgi:hypothetical protein